MLDRGHLRCNRLSLAHARARCPGALGSILQGGMSRSQARHRHAEWRARDIIEADFIEKVHGAWVTAVLAANADFKRGPPLAALPGRHLDQLSDAFAIEHLERIILENAFFDVTRQEA